MKYTKEQRLQTIVQYQRLRLNRRILRHTSLFQKKWSSYARQWVLTAAVSTIGRNVWETRLPWQRIWLTAYSCFRNTIWNIHLMVTDGWKPRFILIRALSCLIRMPISAVKLRGSRANQSITGTRNLEIQEEYSRTFCLQNSTLTVRSSALSVIWLRFM